MSIFVLMRGVRYAISEVLSAHATEASARDKVVAEFPDMEEQAPSANGWAASWLDADLNFMCVQELPVQP